MKIIIAVIILLMPFMGYAYFTGPYGAVNQASQQMMMNTVVTNETIHNNEGSHGDIQKFYDHDERVICYVYINYNISCVNDETN